MSTSAKLVYWAPRILCILAILFVSMFALDSFAPGLTIWQQLGAFLIHLLPSFILLAVLIIAWKWEHIGGYAFIALGVILSLPVFMLNYNRTHSIGLCLGIIAMITLPFALVGILFLVSHNMKKKRLQLN